MRAVIQRVRQARVEVAGERVSEMGSGLLALVGVAGDDDEADARTLAEKIVGLRIFEDAGGKMNRCLAEEGGTLGVVSQFTVLADCTKGRRPSFGRAAAPAGEPGGKCSRPRCCGRDRSISNDHGGLADEPRAGHRAVGYEEPSVSAHPCCRGACLTRYRGL